MLRVFPKPFSSRIIRLTAICAGALIFIALAPVALRAQRQRAAPDPDADNRPAFSDFKGVSIGMLADAARKKLGNPREKGAEQDFYMFGDNQAVQIYYDKTGAVNAISIDFMNGANGVPSCKDVLGAEVEKKPDGSVYKLVRYPKVGYWVSYSRTAGDSATVTITMQKIQQ
jgi:hypothetical protein